MEAMTKKQKERVESLATIIKENPDLPVFPMVAYEVVSDDGYDQYVGELGECYVGEFYIIGEQVFIKDSGDWDEIEKVVTLERGRDEFEDMEWFGAVSVYNGLPWTKAIIMDINPIE